MDKFVLKSLESPSIKGPLHWQPTQPSVAVLLQGTGLNPHG